MKGERGFALVITLVVTALLVALTAEFVNEVYVETSARQNFVNAQQASLLAESGVTTAVKGLQFILPGQSYSSLLDLWAMPWEKEDETGRLRVTIEEESGKLNINAIVNPNNTDSEIYRPIAERLFSKLGLKLELLDAVADWIDMNDEPRPAGAETPHYKTLKPPYGTKNGALETFEALRLVRGFDGKTVEQLRPYITVYPDLPGAPTVPININTAAKELIASLDEKMTDDLAEQIMEERKSSPFKSSTDLGNRVPGMGRLAADLASNSRIMREPEKGAVYRILSQATVGETTRVIEAVVRVSGQPAYLYWREY